jgi:hypothetical protein
MRGLRITDGTNLDPTAALPEGEVGGLNFDLAQILLAMGDRATNSSWRLSDVDCFGAAYPEVASAVSSATLLNGDVLLGIARRVVQVIDGEFVGTDPGARDPWIRVFAVDSTWWEVWTDDETVRTLLRRRFKSVDEVSESAA